MSCRTPYEVPGMVDVVLIAPASQGDEDGVLLFVAFLRATKDDDYGVLRLGEVSHGLYSDEAVACLPLFIVVVSRHELRRAHAYRLELRQSVLEHHDLNHLGTRGHTLVSKFRARL